MPLQKITELTVPPVVGKAYLVPGVVYPWLSRKAAWVPVLGVKHEDREHLNFPWQHYHADMRFLNKREWEAAAQWSRHAEGVATGPYNSNGWGRSFATHAERDAAARRTVAGSPLQQRLPHFHPDMIAYRERLKSEGREAPSRDPDEPTVPHPDITWRQRTCQREQVYSELVRGPIDKALTPAFEGKVCKHSKHGFICPHRGLPLGSVPIVDGVITCPLHGLRIDATSGVVLGPVAPLDKAA